MKVLVVLTILVVFVGVADAGDEQVVVIFYEAKTKLPDFLYMPSGPQEFLEIYKNEKGQYVEPPPENKSRIFPSVKEALIWFNSAMSGSHNIISLRGLLREITVKRNEKRVETKVYSVEYKWEVK